ncbi:MAG: ThiF family adenylyltransferase [Myxococcaceae bacterium]
MPLSEAQIVRYSRQILLRTVGGPGQAKLLELGAALSGEGSAQATAAAYLAAGGTPLSARERPVAPEEAGFLLAAADSGRPLGAMLHASLLDSNPDALAKPPAYGTVGELPASFSGQAPWLALGWSGRRGALVYRSEQGCAGCFEATAQGLSNGPSGASSVLLGALGALAYQRLVLGLAEGLAAFWLEEEGGLSPMELTRCSLHQGAP